MLCDKVQLEDHISPSAGLWAVFVTKEPCHPDAESSSVTVASISIKMLLFSACVMISLPRSSVSYVILRYKSGRRCTETVVRDSAHLRGLQHH